MNVGSGKTLNVSGALIVPGATVPAQTAEGSVVWDTNDDLLTVGTGAGRKTMADTDSTQTLTGKTLTSPTINTPTVAGGTVNNAAIGGTTPAAGAFTTLSASGSVSFLPTGVIVMWSGAVAAIPAGWLLCDGTNSTPDLRDRFVIGARQDDAGVAKTNVTGSLTVSGGSKDAIVVAHGHTASSNTTGAHTHTYNNDPTATSAVHPTGSGSVNSRGNNEAEFTTSSNGAHSHTITVDSAGSSGTNANLPPYYALAFIMRA
jgi:hypothetical protein